mgnify:CR=1 FL=1
MVEQIQPKMVVVDMMMQIWHLLLMAFTGAEVNYFVLYCMRMRMLYISYMFVVCISLDIFGITIDMGTSI